MSRVHRPKAEEEDLAVSFDDDIEFFDEILGAVHLNKLERDCIDSPEFRRLFHVSQLGLVGLLYHTANHTRGMHSIGACAKAKLLVEQLNKNTPRITAERRRLELPAGNLPKISPAERCLITLAALLHDIPHGPLSHDIEKKTHRYNKGTVRVKSHYGPYDKHDDFDRNPALFLMLFDAERSVLARVLQRYSPNFWRLLQQDAAQDEYVHLRTFCQSHSRSSVARSKA